MGLFQLDIDLKQLPERVFFLVLVFYPLFSVIVWEVMGMNPEYVFGFICFGYLTILLYNIYKRGKNLNVPYYILIFTVFTVYTVLSSIFISNEFIEKGAFNYLYSSSIVRTLIAFIIVENTCFSSRQMKFAIKMIGLTLVLAALVSVIQIFEPLFLIKDDDFIQGLSPDRMVEYYKTNPALETGRIDRTLEGYRLSIFSYMGGISVGIDCIAIFSLLIALKANKWLKMAVWVIAAALVSFLSSARWIMLNFLIVASQQFWYARNQVFIILKYSFYLIVLILLLVSATELAGIDIQKFIEERMLDDSASTRVLAFEVFLKVYPDNPIFGTGGVDTEKVRLLLKGRSSQIHVGYLKLFYYYGLIGGLLYLSFLAALLIRMWKIARQSKYWGGFFAILTFAIANLTLVEFSLFYYGLLLALIFSKYFYEESINNLSSININTSRD